MTRAALAGGDKRFGSADSVAKIKYDRQIVAITKVAGARSIYSDDKGVANFASRFGIQVITCAELPLPPEKAQMELGLNQAESLTDEQSDIAIEEPEAPSE